MCNVDGRLETKVGCDEWQSDLEWNRHCGREDDPRAREKRLPTLYDYSALGISATIASIISGMPDTNGS